MKTNRFISLLLCVVMIMSLFTGLAGSASADDVIVHEVQSGEIMLKICEKHGLNYYACKNAIMQLNGFTSEAQLGKLSVGQKIKLPASDALAGSVSTTSAVVTSTTIGGTTMTTTTSYVGTTATGGNIAYYLTAYTVQAGDTLAGICNKLGSNYYYYSPVILGINSLANANYIRPGQVLLIPTSTPGGAGYAVVAHQVQPGETTTSICNRYGVSYQAMRQLVNGLNRRDNMDKIYVGQTVYVPTTNASAAATTTISTGTTTVSGTPSTGTTTGTSSLTSGYSITLSSGMAFASSNGKDYITTAAPGSEVSVWSSTKNGYAVKSIEVIRLDTGAPVPVDYNYFTMPSSNVYVDVTYEKGLTIQKEKALYGSFDAVVYGSSASAAFQGDEVTVMTYPYSFYSVASVSYQKSDRSVSAVEVKPDAEGNYKFTMPSYSILLKVTFAPTQYHKLTANGTVGQGSVQFKVGKEIVTRAEAGQIVTMTFIPAKNWEFNTSDFESNLLAHMPAKNSVGNFQKVNDTTYTFVMGSSDIAISGVQFLNRTVFTISIANQSGSGTVRASVIDQTTGNISFTTNQAKFGDTVLVRLLPGNNFIADIEYMKGNSRANGNLLSWGAGTTNFTMPDGNVTLNVRFIQDGAKHTYSTINCGVTPASAGRLALSAADGSNIDTAEAGDVILVSVIPKPNYEVNKAKSIGGTDIWSVTLNGKYTDDAPASSNFTYLGQDATTNTQIYSFVKSAGTDVLRASFASDYQNVPIKFQQIIDGVATPTDPQNPPVKAIKDLKVNGSIVENGTNVIAGDTVSFTLVLNEDYEVVQVRKFVNETTTPAEVSGTTRILPGGSNNSYSYSYTVTKDDIHRNSTGDIDGELIFEITVQQKAAYSYTVHYTEPMIGGQKISSFAPGKGIYTLAVSQLNGGAVLGKPAAQPSSSDITDISAGRVEDDDALITIKIPVAANTNIIKNDANAQKQYVYNFEKLLINGYEWDSLENDGTYYTADIVYPKDTDNRIVTTELVYKLSATYDYPAATVDDIKIDTVAIASFKPSVLSYVVNSNNAGGATVPLVDATTTAPVERKIVINGSVYTDFGQPAPTTPGEVAWLEGPNVVEIYARDSSTPAGMQETKYTITVNYGLPAAKLTKLELTGPATGMAEFDPTMTDYVAHVTKEELKVIPTPDAGVTATVEINGVATDTRKLSPGPNTVKITATGANMSPTVYTVTVYYDVAETTELSAIDITGSGVINPTHITVVPGQLEYTASVSGSETNDIKATLPSAGDITIIVNDELIGTGVSVTDLTKTAKWHNGVNTVLIQVKQDEKVLTTYTLKVNCSLEASALKTLAVDGTPILAAGKTSYSVNVSKDTSTIDLTSISGTASITYSVNGGTEVTTLSSSFNVTWPQEKDNKLIIKVKEADKTETVYTLTVTKKYDASLVENYVNIDGDAIAFNSSRSASYTTLGLTSKVIVTLDPTLTMESLKLEINGVLYGTAPTTGMDSLSRPTYTFSDVTWKSGGNNMKVYVKYTEQAETVYTVSVQSKADNLALAEALIENDPATGNYKNGASGVKLYGTMTKVQATAINPNATVTINVYGDVSDPTKNPQQATGLKTATVNTIKWNTDGNESNRIDIIVECDGYSRTYTITGAYQGATP